jgi:hypothetical protein
LIQFLLKDLEAEVNLEKEIGIDKRTGKEIEIEKISTLLAIPELQSH